MTVEELLARITAEAARRGIGTDQLMDELAAQLPAEDPLESFIGCGASGRAEPFDIRRARADAAAKKSTQAI